MEIMRFLLYNLFFYIFLFCFFLWFYFRFCFWFTDNLLRFHIFYIFFWFGGTHNIK